MTLLTVFVDARHKSEYKAANLYMSWPQYAVLGLKCQAEYSECWLCCPLLYSGQENLYFSLPAIVGWLGTALLHAAIVVTMVMTGSDSLESDRFAGNSWSLLQSGLLMFTVVIITVHLQLAMVIDQWTWFHHVAIWGSIGGCLEVSANMHRRQQGLALPYMGDVAMHCTITFQRHGLRCQLLILSLVSYLLLMQ